MALSYKIKAGPSIAEVELRDDDRFTGDDDDGDRSNVGAFLMGGVVVAGGLLAFLYYDTDNLNSRANGGIATTAVGGRLESPAGSTVPSIRLLPPANGQDGR